MNRVTGISYVTSPLSEYIGSHIYEILGYDVHKTILGICNDGKRNKVVCACKDFIKDDTNEKRCFSTGVQISKEIFTSWSPSSALVLGV